MTEWVDSQAGALSHWGVKAGGWPWLPMLTDSHTGWPIQLACHVLNALRISATVVLICYGRAHTISSCKSSFKINGCFWYIKLYFTPLRLNEPLKNSCPSPSAAMSTNKCISDGKWLLGHCNMVSHKKQCRNCSYISRWRGFQNQVFIFYSSLIFISFLIVWPFISLSRSMFQELDKRWRDNWYHPKQ